MEAGQRPYVIIIRNTMQMEEQISFTNDGLMLFGVLHTPQEEKTDNCRVGIIFCHPFAEEKKCAHRVFVEAARELCMRGFYVLRFDYRGCGDSEGKFENTTMGSCVSDIRESISLFCAKVDLDRIGLLGLRLGGTFAAHVAELDRRVDFLILWSPVVDVEHYFRVNLRKKLVKELHTSGKVKSKRANLIMDLENRKKIEFDGYIIGDAFYREASTFDLAANLRSFRGPVGVFQISYNSKISRELQRLTTRYREIRANSELFIILGPAFWNRIGLVKCSELIDGTLEFVASLTGRVEQRDRCHNLSDRREVSAFVSRVKMEQQVTFFNEGKKVFGFVHVPEQTATPGLRTVIVFLHGWSGYRIGPHQMYVKAARRLCNAGFYCLRFDFRGRGDSEGDTDMASHKSMISDTTKAVEFVWEKNIADRIILLGMCSGGNIAIDVASRTGSVDGVVLWSAHIPTKNRHLARVRAFQYLAKEYLRKMRQPATWRKIVNLEINLRFILRLVGGALLNNPISTNADVSENQQESLDISVVGLKKPSLFIFGGNDPGTKNSLNYYKSHLHNVNDSNEFHIIDGANHSFYSVTWENEVIEKTIDWVKRFTDGMSLDSECKT